MATIRVAKLHQSEPKSVVTAETIAGRTVTVVAPPNDPGAAVEVLFAKSAYLFRVSASDRGHASDAVRLIK